MTNLLVFSPYPKPPVQCDHTRGGHLADGTPCCIKCKEPLATPRTIEGRQIRDLRDLRDFVDACINATGNVKLNVPYDMRLIQTDNRYNLEVTRW